MTVARYPLQVARFVMAGLLVLGACKERDQSRNLVIEPLRSPAGPGAAEPNLALEPGGSVMMTWIEPTADSAHAVRIAMLTGTDDTTGAWGPASTVITSRELFVNWADFPSAVALGDSDVAVHWLQRSGPGRYSYDVRIARSADRGRTWTAGRIPHRDGTETEHGFTSMYALPNDSLGAVWLDGRLYDTTRTNATKEMMLMSTSMARDGSLGAEVPLDHRICDCCQTSMALATRGPVIVYRDRTMDEVRDIYIVRRVNGRWTEPAPVHRDHWKIDFCPVNGPAVSARGDTLAVAWFTGARDSTRSQSDSGRVMIAFSFDGGATFGPPVRVDDGRPAGRVDVELEREHDGAWVTWLERTGGDKAEVRIRRIAFGGEAGPAVSITPSLGARASGFPRMVRFGDALLFAWTEPGTPSRVRVAWASIPPR